MGKKGKGVLYGGFALVLGIFLVFGACAPVGPAPSDEELEPVAPTKVQTWRPATYTDTGPTWDVLRYMSEYITKISDGRLIVTPSNVGGVCPVTEQLDAVASGATPAMDIWPGYHEGRIPITLIMGEMFGAAKTIAEMRYVHHVYANGRAYELFEEVFAKYGDVHLVTLHYLTLDSTLCSNVPIYGIDDLKGVKIRTSGIPAKALASLGAGTVFAPVPEVYTMLASGVVDAAAFGSPLASAAVGFQEVTKYWVRKPVLVGPGCNAFIVNGTVWRELPDDLKALVKVAMDAAIMRVQYDNEVATAALWKSLVEDYGIEIIEWPEEDVKAWYIAMRDIVQELRVDPASNELLDILDQYANERGYY